MSRKQLGKWLITGLATAFLCACSPQDISSPRPSDGINYTVPRSVNNQNDPQWQKGFQLPISPKERQEAEQDCLSVMADIADIYRQADQGSAVNVVLAAEDICQMIDRIQERGYPVTGSNPYSKMEHYGKMEQFLQACREGQSGSMILYEVYSGGGIGRLKWTADGTNLYLLSAKASWNEDNEPVLSWISYDRIREWRLTPKGWFCYDLCVPEPPEVSELVDGSQMVRVRPLDETCRAWTKKCVQSLGYQGNNLLCSNWDVQNLQDLDYIGAFEYLYRMKYGKPLDQATYEDGIPAEEFENVILDYLPVDAQQLRTWAGFNEARQAYNWAGQGCLNYAPTFFGTSLPEVTAVRENDDGTVTLTVDAICDMLACDDAVITHLLTIRLREDGSFQYLGNYILEEGITKIPEYQYRMKR